MAHKIENTTSYTEQQLEYLNRMQAVCDKAKELKENCNGYVVAGNDGAGEDYCYCGEGKGYEGEPLRSACIWAVVFESKEEAYSKAKSLIGYRNGAGHENKLYVHGAWYYFGCIYSQMLGIIYTAKHTFQELNNKSK